MNMEIAECFYPAGSALLFDSQGIHRMRRSITAEPRYSITYYFHPCQQYRVVAQKIHPEVRPEDKKRMASMMTIAK